MYDNDPRDCQAKWKRSAVIKYRLVWDLHYHLSLESEIVFFDRIAEWIAFERNYSFQTLKWEFTVQNVNFFTFVISRFEVYFNIDFTFEM